MRKVTLTGELFFAWFGRAATEKLRKNAVIVNRNIWLACAKFFVYDLFGWNKLLAAKFKKIGGNHSKRQGWVPHFFPATELFQFDFSSAQAPPTFYAFLCRSPSRCWACGSLAYSKFDSQSARPVFFYSYGDIEWLAQRVHEFTAQRLAQ